MYEYWENGQESGLQRIRIKWRCRIVYSLSGKLEIVGGDIKVGK